MAEQSVTVERLIAAPPSAIFDLLADPSQHAVIDGSGTVKGHRGEQVRLALGSRFGMNMKFGVPYRMQSTVKEFEENRLIAWAHFGGHRWRYDLEPVDGGTIVRETFDWSASRWPKGIELVGYPKRHRAAMAATLERIAAIVEGPKAVS